LRIHIKTSKSATTKLGTRVQLRFSIGLDIREKLLITDLVKFFNLQDFDKYIYTTENAVNFQITNFTDIMNIIIPFFEQYPIEGIKKLDYMDFKTVGDLMLNKEHLTQSGLDNIINIQSNMNRSRLLS